jgi:protease I
MMSNDKKVAILATNGFEESELFSPKEAIERENIQVEILSPEIGKIKAWKHGNWSKEIDVDVAIRDVDANDFDLLILPGGVINPDKLRRNEHVVNFIRRFFLDGKPVAAICHGAQTLIDAEVVRDKTMTSFFSIKKDLQNAGANWIDSNVVLDDNLITSRNPDDLQAFNKKILNALGVKLESN